MSIELHCPSCSKLIRAPADAGGKRGKCPYCKQSVYIPMPADDTDIIGLAPVDETAERRAEALREESIRYATTLDHGGKTAKPRNEASPAAAGKPDPDAHPGEVVDIPKTVERFVLAMRDSKLSEAEQAVALLERTHTRARDYVEGIMLDEMPPTFEDVPPPLVKGFLKKLLERLS